MFNVGAAVILIGEEMKHGAVMPHVVTVVGQIALPIVTLVFGLDAPASSAN